MRIAKTLAPILLLLPVSVWGQAQATSGTGHFEGWLSGAHWGADKQAFDAKLGIHRVEATFTVASNGFGLHRTFSSVEETFNLWEEVRAWCWGPGRVLFRTQQQSLGVYDLNPEDLVTIVEGYFKKYLPEAEWSAPEWECTSGGLSRPNPANIAKILELLEAASSQKKP